MTYMLKKILLILGYSHKIQLSPISKKNKIVKKNIKSILFVYTNKIITTFVSTNNNWFYEN